LAQQAGTRFREGKAMTINMLPKFKLAAGLLAAVSPLAASAAAAQSAPSSDYDRGYQAGRAEAARSDQSGGSDQPPQQGYDDRNNDQGPPDGYDVAPQGYDGTEPPPPPPGYQPQAGYSGNDPQDRRYEAYAEDWAQRYCVRSSGNAAGGAVIGGLLGALVGSSVAGRHDRGAGALMGGIAGAAGGAAVGTAEDNATSPGCPPGYVARGGAPGFAYDDYGSPYDYAAPGWYRPWIFVGGRWNYRPYPYHSFYYSRYGYGRGFGYGGRRGGYNRGGYRDGHRHPH
jgi:hypothetical protein